MSLCKNGNANVRDRYLFGPEFRQDFCVLGIFCSYRKNISLVFFFDRNLRLVCTWSFLTEINYLHFIDSLTETV